MKKVISVVLAVIMLFSALAISSVAESDTEHHPTVPQAAREFHESLRKTDVLKDDQVVIAFDLLNSGATFKFPVTTYDINSGEFKTTKNIKGIYYMVPDNSDPANSSYLTPGTKIVLPTVVAPNGAEFKGWEYVDLKGNPHTLTAGSIFTIPEGSDVVGMLYFSAVLVAGEYEVSFLDSILDTLMGILSNVVDTLMNGGLASGDSIIDILMGAIGGAF